MSNPYKDPRWLDFRARIIAIDDGKCCECDRSQADGVVLHVHHLGYVPGREPWEYTEDECQTLCRGCHAMVHGRIKPSSGWEFDFWVDLESVCGNCEDCDTDLRYEFHISHPNWESLVVGTCCCDRLTGTTQASDWLRRRKGFRDRLATFLNEEKWDCTTKGEWRKYKNLFVEIHKIGDEFCICIDCTVGKKKYNTADGAKQAAFEFFDSGEAARWHKRCSDRCNAARATIRR